MGNKICFCCIKDDAIAKLDNDLEKLLGGANNRSIKIGECSFCKKANEVCFRNYGSLGRREILICVICDIDLERKDVLY